MFQQAEFIAQRVLELHHEYDLPLSRMAVLYRNHRHSLELQVELTRRQIPYTVRSGLRFFEQAHIKRRGRLPAARARTRRTACRWIRLLRSWPGVGAPETAEQLARAPGQRDSRGNASTCRLSRWPSRRASGAGGPGRRCERLAELRAILEDPEPRGPGR